VAKKKQKKLVIEFIFDEDTDDDYPRIILRKVRLGKETTLSYSQRSAITEVWGQSDMWHVDIHNDILQVIDEGGSMRYGGYYD